MGKKVDHIELPPWAKNNPYYFIVYHRIMFESNIVTKSINDWIDLIFGYK